MAALVNWSRAGFVIVRVNDEGVDQAEGNDAMKTLLTLIALVAWAALMLGNILGAGRTAGQMQLKDGISEGEARHRTTRIVVGAALVQTFAVIFALWLIWK